VTGEGADPCGRFRAGFQGTVTIDAKAFGMEPFKPGHEVQLELLLEGIRK
jgi:polyisoprenoid-binding protein YceI